MRASLQDIIALSRELPSFRTIAERLGNDTAGLDISGLYGSAKALLVTHLFGELSRTILVLTGKAEEAESLRDDLEEFCGAETVRYFPLRETRLPGRSALSAEATGFRMETLAGLARNMPVIVVAPVQAVLEGILAPARFRSRMINLSEGQAVDFDGLARQFLQLGFERESLVGRVGQFSIRGGILDFFPYAVDKPVRIEFAGDLIESIRAFDIRTQRSSGRQATAVVLPCSDEPGEPDQAGSTPATLADYLPATAILFMDEPELIEHQARPSNKGGQAPGPDMPGRIHEGTVSYEHVRGQLEAFPVVAHHLLPGGQTGMHIGAKAQEPFNGDLRLLKDGLNRLTEIRYRSFIVCDTQTQAERLAELDESLGDQVRFIVGHLHHGFLLPEGRLAVYTDHEIFHRHRLPHRTPKFADGAPIRDIGTLRQGDIVVHLDYGIGRFEGLRHIMAQEKEQDCLAIAYQSNDRLYVPVDQLNQVQKYVGAEGAVPQLSRLGGFQWERTKERTKKAIAAMADDLIKTAAARKSQKGHTFSPPSEWQRELETAFPYEETADQLKALEEVMQDMERPAPMDRLICGDVGYGKTEVAIRAAFRAAMDNKQTAVLVPTTILAQQHLKTFRERMRAYPVRVEMLSRFKSRAEQQLIVAGLKSGTVDIIIGTHRLLQKDVQFRDLGLLVIDEEQRFGVAHKERLKKLKTAVDILTLTATPIPRTLHMSLLGARDMSVINTAPRERIPIRTGIVPFDEKLIREAILHEVGRGGQVYFVHNRVQSIHAMATLLKKIVPEISIAVAHGQMDEHRLEKEMFDFLDRRYDCLLSTMIIEAGLDIPNVNTIIINRADRFGLAQLYQLRGRVGRSDRLAYAYLLVPPLKRLTETARQRLQALQEFTELGSGFQLAMRDLEIRGTGNLLGPQQHGFIAAVGFDLYCRLLSETVQELKGEAPQARAEPKLEMAVEAYIPESYIPDNEQKMQIYQRLAALSSYEALLDMEEELRDRFGVMPGPVRALAGVMALRTLARNLHISRLSLAKKTLSLEFSPGGPSPRQWIEAILSRSPVPVTFKGEGALAAGIGVPEGSDEEMLGFVKNFLLHIHKGHRFTS